MPTKRKKGMEKDCKKGVVACRPTKLRGTAQKSLKLTVDLVPKTSWRRNLRDQVSRSVWDRLRKQVFAEANFKCQICGAEGRLNCDELWEFDEKNHVQRLKGFRAVCSMCHHVKHFGKSSILAEEGKLNLEKMIKHFMSVNKVPRMVFKEHLAAAMNIWEQLSQYEWTIDYGEWRTLIQNPSA